MMNGQWDYADEPGASIIPAKNSSTAKLKLLRHFYDWLFATTALSPQEPSEGVRNQAVPLQTQPNMLSYE